MGLKKKKKNKTPGGLIKDLRYILTKLENVFESIE